MTPIDVSKQRPLDKLLCKCETSVQVVLSLAQRAAVAAGREAPKELSEDAMEAWKHAHWYMGGHPRLLCLFLACLGPRMSRDTWPAGV